MAALNGIFSLRLVIADFYMEKPLPGLDTVYSEFRGKEIKKVPIIRVFGPNSQGQKTCMHIHGIFPYFYVPYDQNEFESVNKAIHQMAINLDKAINVSLNQGSSTVQHVFKIQLVKGIPFYGYHKSEHHFLKVYMFNPRFIRRAANLLQNGAVLNKIFHPHESHVPYILQFMIDYNLYGMSFLHVPLEIVKFRRNETTDRIAFKNVLKSQILDCNVVKKLSCSTLEIDISSSFILNRFQLVSKTNTIHTNPGIESIWNDEKLRRQNMAKLFEDDEEKLKTIPPLKVPPLDERANIFPTESETFYMTALVSKLAALETSQTESSQGTNETINSTFQTNSSIVTINSNKNQNEMTNRRRKKTFNLTKILQNSVYPEECTQNENENLVNAASFVENHLPSRNTFEQSLLKDMSVDVVNEEKQSEDESIFLDDTMVDEELILSLTQIQQQAHIPLDATLRDEDLELLDILQLLEEKNNNSKIDLDSSLAPLSQNKDDLRDEDLELINVLQQLEENNNNSKIDLDSSLAPLSQNNDYYKLPQNILQQTISQIKSPPSNVDCGGEENIEEDNVHDFSIALESLDDLILKFTQSQTDMDECNEHRSNSTTPTQFDGADDLLKTPTKRSISKGHTTPPRTPTTKPRRMSYISPSRSPRTPKSGHKFKPLPLIITNRSAGKISLDGKPDETTETTPTSPSTSRESNLHSKFLRKRTVLNEFRRKSISVETNAKDCDNNLPYKTNLNRRRSGRHKDLDKTHITCNLTPRKTNEKLLKVYQLNGNAGQATKCLGANENKEQSPICLDSNENKEHESTPKSPTKNEESVKPQENAISSFVDDDEEVVDSEDESTIHLRKTPNLKRLRRSFLSCRSIKRHKEKNSSKVEQNTASKNEKTSCVTTKTTDQFFSNSPECLGSKEFEKYTPSANLEACCKSPKLKASDADKCQKNLQLNMNSHHNDNEIQTLRKLPEVEAREKMLRHGKVIEFEKNTRSKSISIKNDHSNIKQICNTPVKIIPNSELNEFKSKKLKLENKATKKVRVRLKRVPKSYANEEIYNNNRSKTQIDHGMEKTNTNLFNKELVREKNGDQCIKSIVTRDKQVLVHNSNEISKSSFKQSTSYSSLNDKILLPSIGCASPISSEDHSRESPDQPKSADEEINGKAPNDKVSEDIKLKHKATKKIRIRVKRIRNKISNDLKTQNLETLEEVKTNGSKTLINHDMEKTNTEKLLRGKNVDQFIKFDVTTVKQSASAINSDNLLKSLLKFNGAVRNNNQSMSSAPLIDPIVLPSTGWSSQTSSEDLFQESPEQPKSSDEEIDSTTPTCSMDNASGTRVYEKFVTLHSPNLFTQHSSEILIPPNLQNSLNSLKDHELISISSSNSVNDNLKDSPSSLKGVTITPLDLPPTADEVLKGCEKMKLPKYEFQEPYYSNPLDITKHKEIGFTILQIHGNKLNDLEEFQSILGPDLKGLSRWRRNHMLRLGGPEMLNKYRNTQRIREYFADQKPVAITPQMHAPTRQEVKVWLKARALLKNKGEHLVNNEDTIKRLTEEDSPIKIRRQKVTMMLNNDCDENGEEEDCDNNLDCSLKSLTLTPLTPGTPLAAEDSLREKINKSFTPLSTKIEKISLQRINCIRKRHNRRILKRVSLTKKMIDALEKDKTSSNNSSQNSGESKNFTSNDESAIPHSQKSESSSVSSQTALAEMERSSFMHQIQQHDVTIGFGDSNSTINNTFGFKVALENLQQAKADIEFNYLTIITLEVFVTTRDDLFPDPKIDEIRCLFYAIENSIPNDHIDNDKKLPRTSCGYIMVHDSRDIIDKEGKIHGIDQDIEVTIVQTEVEALETLLGLCSRWDPDIYAGYEIEMSSWGFVIDRAKYLCLNIAPLLSRVPSQKTRDFVDEDREQFTDLDVEMKLCGRILLDVWRLMRSEIALTSYTFENVMYHIMHKRCPWHSYRTLTEWFSAPCSRWIVMEYYLERVRGTLALLDQLDLIGRTSEMAKLIGIQFYEVLSRGSQFRVESMMLRIAKPKNIVPLSPSVQQRAHMRAPEYLPLILEPQSRFYADPLIVLDFQSLYPSMIIGYNYCFSTCLGRVEHLGQSTPFEFGASQLRVSPSMLRKLIDNDLITISPCGVVFVKTSVREGIVPRMLTEILDTRQMVKQSMKVHKTNSALQRILHSRQLGLKLMANTTYGYTAANFSGRMPAVEVGDSVVAKGRETLERAIKVVEANEKWNVRVVYGDTDSLFVLVPGRDREEAFRIGEEIAETITNQNPQPVKLKLEKVYQPCILQTKKRYVGYMYETADQKEPVYEAKGIETVRRDGCPIVARMLERVLRILFETADVSHIKHYVCRQFTKLLSGRANLQDLIFAKEFRGLNGYKPTACVPALELTRKWLQTDPRRIPRRGERVPFIITNGPPGVPLIRLIRHPHEVLKDEGFKINAIYYITKAIIPPLNRCLLLLGADVNEWFANLPRKVLMTPALSVANEIIACPNAKTKKSTISQFFSATNCITDCGRHTKHGICTECKQNSFRTITILQMKISKIERAYLTSQQICQSCCGRLGDIKCGSLECPVLYVLEVKRRDLQQIAHFRNLLEDTF